MTTHELLEIITYLTQVSNQLNAAASRTEIYSINPAWSKEQSENMAEVVKRLSRMIPNLPVGVDVVEGGE